MRAGVLPAINCNYFQINRAAFSLWFGAFSTRRIRSCPHMAALKTNAIAMFPAAISCAAPGLRGPLHAWQ
jgi:hypothetical protein